uniref:Eosinophil cationic protein n=1 Tax=Prolemur simus TaxID=1328070 RepID=A0A8C8ZHH1_PROSS
VVPKLLDSQLCLLLLLGLMGMVGSFHAAPPGLTWAGWFEIQHIHRTHIPCDNAMRVVNSYTGQCKVQNTFLHTAFANVVNVCHTQNRTCHTSRSTNCHKSFVPVSLTYCSLKIPRASVANCRYRQKPEWKFYMVACDRRSPKDNPKYPVVPVHLDATLY